MWEAPLDVGAAVRAIPSTATICGMFIKPVVAACRAAGRPLKGARASYLPFEAYPLREHAQALVEAMPVLFPGVPARQALRKLGRAAPAALLDSTLGRVTLGVATSPEHALRAMCDLYPVNLKPCRVELLDSSDRQLTVRFVDVYHFLDSHHVGVLEGTMRFAGVRGQVDILMRSPFDGDLRCRW